MKSDVKRTVLLIKRLVDRIVGSLVILALSLFRRSPTILINPERPVRIVLCNLVGLGDSVYLLTLAGLIRERLPDARLLGLVTERSAGVWKKDNIFDLVETLDFSTMRLWRTFRQFHTLRKAFQPDVFIDAEQKLLITSLLAMISGSGMTIGFGNKGSVRRKAYSNPVVPKEDIHMLENYIELLRQLLPEIETPQILIRPDIEPEDARTIKLKVLDASIPNTGYAVLHPGCGPSAPQRRWIPDRFSAVAHHLVEKYTLQVILTGNAGDREIIRQIVDRCGVPVQDYAGWFTVGEMTALLSQAAILVSVDTGIMHLGAALEIPVIGLFGPESPVRYRPLSERACSVYKGIECSPCIHPFRNRGRKCQNAVCMSGIGVDDVVKEIETLIRVETGQPVDK